MLSMMKRLMEARRIDHEKKELQRPSQLHLSISIHWRCPTTLYLTMGS